MLNKDEYRGSEKRPPQSVTVFLPGARELEIAPACYPSIGQSIPHSSPDLACAPVLTPFGTPMTSPLWSAFKVPPKLQYLPSLVPSAAPYFPSPNAQQMCCIFFHYKHYGIYNAFPRWVREQLISPVPWYPDRYTDTQIPHFHHLHSTSQFVVHK